MSQTVLDAAGMRRTLGRLAHEVLESNGGGNNLVVIGILRRGWPVAKRLAFTMAQIEDNTIPHGKLDVRPNRDDHAEMSTPDQTEVPFSITDKTVVLVDEVIFTGRTIRAALDALMKFGRPRDVRLCVLVDRGHRELPIQPDFCGVKLSTDPSDHIHVNLTDYADEDSVLLLNSEEKQELSL